MYDAHFEDWRHSDVVQGKAKLLIMLRIASINIEINMAIVYILFCITHFFRAIFLT